MAPQLQLATDPAGPFLRPLATAAPPLIPHVPRARI